MSCTPLPKAAKAVWAKELTRLPCLVVYVKFQFMECDAKLRLKSLNASYILLKASVLNDSFDRYLKNRGAELEIINLEAKSVHDPIYS